MISIPFLGSKRNWVRAVKEIAADGGYGTVLEPFGGSCVISANLFADGLVGTARVNDYDGLFDVYGEFLDVKDYVVSECLKRGLRPVRCDKKGYYQMEGEERAYLKGMVLPKGDREILQSVISGVDKKWWRLLACGTNFCFSIVATHEEIRLSDFSLFHRRLDTKAQREYLSVIRRMDRVSMDWRDFLADSSRLFGPGTLIVADPPYPNTPQTQYKGGMREADEEMLLRALAESGCGFVFFGYDEARVAGTLSEYGLSCGITRKTVQNWSANGRGREFMAYVRRG